MRKATSKARVFLRQPDLLLLQCPGLQTACTRSRRGGDLRHLIVATILTLNIFTLHLLYIWNKAS